MKNKLLFTQILALLFAMAAEHASAQSLSERKPIFGGISVGSGYSGYLHMNNNYTLFADRGRSVLAVTYRTLSHNSEDEGVIANLKDTMHVLELRYGRTVQVKKFRFKGSAGVSLVSFKGRGQILSTETLRNSFLGLFFNDRIVKTYAKRSANAFGVPLSAEVNFLPRKYYGIGLEIFANFNSIHSYVGLGLHVSLGKLRPALHSSHS